jgi:hypothetical protein
VADRWKKHDLVAAVSLFTCGAIVLLVGDVDLPWFVLIFTFTVAGLINGVIRPARDMMIRNASPKGSIGKTFGFVYLGEFISDDLARHSMTCTLWLAARHRRGGMDFWSAAVFFVMCGMMFIGSGRAARQQQPA